MTQQQPYVHSLPLWMHGKERIVFYSLAATAGAALATAAYYATKDTFRQVVPLQVRVCVLTRGCVRPPFGQLNID